MVYSATAAVWPSFYGEMFPARVWLLEPLSGLVDVSGDRCQFLRVDSTQLPRIEEMTCNAEARLAEAQNQARLGEVAAGGIAEAPAATTDRGRE